MSRNERSKSMFNFERAPFYCYPPVPKYWKHSNTTIINDNFSLYTSVPFVPSRLTSRISYFDLRWIHLNLAKVFPTIVPSPRTRVPIPATATLSQLRALFLQLARCHLFLRPPPRLALLVRRASTALRRPLLAAPSPDLTRSVTRTTVADPLFLHAANPQI